MLSLTEPHAHSLLNLNASGGSVQDLILHWEGEEMEEPQPQKSKTHKIDSQRGS